MVYTQKMPQKFINEALETSVRTRSTAVTSRAGHSFAEPPPNSYTLGQDTSFIQDIL